MMKSGLLIVCVLLTSMAWSQGVRELFTEEELKTLSPQEVQKQYRERLEERRSMQTESAMPTPSDYQPMPMNQPRSMTATARKIPGAKKPTQSVSRGVSKIDKTKLLRKAVEAPVGELMTIDFIDTDIREIVRTVSMAYGYSIIIDNDVTAQISIHLEDVEVIEGLSAICRANNLEIVKEGSIYRISIATEKTIELLKMKRKKMDLDVQNQDVKKFIKSFTEKTGLNILAGKELDGTITGSWKNQLPLDGFKALMIAHDYKVRKRNGFYIVEGSDENLNKSGRRMGGPPSSASRMDVDVSGDSVSVALENAELADVLKIIAQESGINIVFFGDIRENINANLNKQPLAEGISMLLRGSKYTYLITEEGTLLVGSKDPKTPAGKILTSYEMYPLKYLKSENITKILPKSISTTNITIITEHNAILIMGTTSEIESVKRYLDLVDMPIPQVLLECVVVEYNREKGSGYGLKKIDRSVSASGSGDNATTLNNGYAPGAGFLSAAVNFSEYNIVKKQLGDASIGVGFLNSSFEYDLQAQENANKAKVLAMPKIVTLNGNKANIKVTNTTYRLITKSNANDVQVASDYKAFNDGITLALTPFVTNGGQITIDIEPEIKTSAAGGSAESPPNISTRSLATTVSLVDGQTIMLGGLIKTQKDVIKEYVPFLGSLPFVGWLFSWQGTNERTTELVIYITPHIQNPEDFGLDLKDELNAMEGRDGRVDFGKNIDIYRHKGDDSLAFDPIQLDTVALKAIQDSLKAVEGIVIEQDSVVQPGSK